MITEILSRLCLFLLVRFLRHVTRGLDLSVAGQNLFEPHHAEFGIAPAPNELIKRDVYVRLVWTL